MKYIGWWKRIIYIYLWCSSSDFKIVHIAFPGGNNFTTKACVYILPVFNRYEKSIFQCRIAIFYILNATGHCLLLLFIIHICVFPSNNSFSLLKKDCYLTSFSGQYASWTFAKFCLFWMLKKVKQTSIYVSSIACSVYDSKFKFIGNLKHLGIQCYNFILGIPSRFCEISKTALWVLGCVCCGFCRAMGCSTKTISL